MGVEHCTKLVGKFPHAKSLAAVGEVPAPLLVGVERTDPGSVKLILVRVVNDKGGCVEVEV